MWITGRAEKLNDEAKAYLQQNPIAIAAE